MIYYDAGKIFYREVRRNVIMKDSRSSIVQINGTRFAYEVAGEGHPLVLIHGGLVDGRSWNDQFDVFAQHYKVVRYDARGFGDSEVPTQPYSDVEDLYNLLTFLHIEKTYVLGLSRGGSVALDFTLVHPEIVDGLVLSNSGLDGYQLSPENNALLEEVDAALERNDVAQAVELENRMWIDGPERTPDQVNATVRERVREMNTHNYILTLGKNVASPAEVEPQAISRLAEIQVPTLIIIGDKDVHDFIAISNLLVQSIVGAKKVVLPHVAHAPNMEKPEEFNQVVLNFLSTL